MSNFAKSKNQLWRESGTTLTFKDWLERESMKGTIPPKEHLLNVAGKDSSLDTTKLEESLGINNTDKFEKILGINNKNEIYVGDELIDFLECKLIMEKMSN